MAPAPLIDPYGRRIEYLRASLIDHCNLRCVYCRPAKDIAAGRCAQIDAGLLLRTVAAFARLGVRRVRLTGGEPMLRRDLVALVARLAELPGVEDLSLSTNGCGLGRLAGPLRTAGLARVNVSLDSLEPDRYRDITRGGRLQRVLDGIAAARAAGLEPVKLNMVVMRGVNDDEIPAMLDYAAQNGLELRLIETMPLGRPGHDSMVLHVPAAEMLSRLRAHAGRALVPVLSRAGGGPARCYRLAASNITVGVISAVSRHFCATCNRVRLSARGDLLLCLGQAHRVPLRSLIEGGASDAELEAAIRAGIARKPWGHDFSTGGGAQADMSAIGG